jgi:hypothetical protein
VQVIRLLTEKDSYLWQTAGGPLVDKLYELAAGGLRWAVGFDPERKAICFKTFASLLERALMSVEQRDAWDLEHVGDEDTWPWVDALFQQSIDSFMEADGMSDRNNIVDKAGFNSGRVPGVRGFANYCAYHFLEPQFISSEIEDSFSKWEAGAGVKWSEVQMARGLAARRAGAGDGAALSPPVAGLIPPLTGLGNHASHIRWVLELVGCWNSRCAWPIVRVCVGVARGSSPRNANIVLDVT